MHPLLRSPRVLAAYWVSWLLAGAVVATAWSSRRPSELVWTLAFALPVALLTGVSALSMFYVCRRFALRPAQWISALLGRAGAAVLLAFFVAAAAALWNASGTLVGRTDLLGNAPPAWFAFMGISAVIFILSALLHDAFLAQQAAQDAASTEAAALLHARDMEIRALRHQIDPHFLFNCLNSISALTQRDPAAARAMTIDLAEFFRQTLALGERERIRLDDELALVERYVAIEQRRLGDKLRLSLDVATDCRATWLPPLVLQPLVENAIKHGIRTLDSGGTVELAARRSGDRLDLRVSNPVDPSAVHDGSGLAQGLRHLQARLRAHCPDADRVEVERVLGRFHVHLMLPWRP